MNRTHPRQRAFSLVELLVVIAVIGIIATFAVPAMQGMLKGSALSQASNMLNDQMSLARQHALSKNQVVEVRFYRFADPELPGETVTDPASGYFRAFQLFERTDTGAVVGIGTGVLRMPDTIIMNPGPTLSNLLTEDTDRIVTVGEVNQDKGAPELPRGVGKNYEYVQFRFNPDGTTSLPPLDVNGKPTHWFITIHAISDLPRTSNNTKPPPNFFTWMIDPVTGSTKTFRPGVK